MKKSWKSFMTVTAAAAAMTVAMAFSSLAAVAKVGEVEYDDLQTAVNSGDNVVIDLLDNVTLTDGLVIGAGKNVTIQCEVIDPKTITMKNLGIHTAGTLDNHCKVVFKNCNVNAVLSDYPGHSGATVNMISNTDFTLDHVKWNLRNQEEKEKRHGIYLYQASNLYLKNGSELEISGFNVSGSSGIYADESEYEKMGLFHIEVSGQSKINISNCGWNGMTINPTDLTVKGKSEIHVTNCGLSDGRGGIGCYYGKIDVSDYSVITSDQNVGKSWGIFAKELYVDGTSRVSACGNTGYGIEVGGKGIIENGAVLDVNQNTKSGLWVYTSSRSDFWSGDVDIKPGANVSACENVESGIYNHNIFYAEDGAGLKIEGNKNHGIFNKGKLTIGTGVRICNNHAATYGGGLYNGENGTAELSDGVILYNNHAAKGADDIYNTAGRMLTFCVVGTGWNLDDCNHRIDGWYDDTEGTRWNADDDLPENRHIVSVASGGYETGFQIKAAHGADIYETTSYPIDKKADGEDEIGTVSQGKRIEFTLTSTLPKLLARYVVTASNASPANSAREIRKVRVHSASGAGRVRVHSASGAETVRVYSASGARRARSVSGDNYDNEISAQSLSADEKYAIPDSVVETMVFHDEMNRYLKFIDGTLRVTAGRAGKEVPSGYYTVTASGSNAFCVEVDLVNLFNTGIIDYEDLTGENPITVTYEAVVTDDAIQGDELFNEAWVNDGEHDSVEGDVLDKKVPSTGGTGRGMYTGLGLLFMVTAAAAWKRKRSI